MEQSLYFLLHNKLQQPQYKNNLYNKEECLQWCQESISLLSNQSLTQDQVSTFVLASQFLYLESQQQPSEQENNLLFSSATIVFYLLETYFNTNQIKFYSNQTVLELLNLEFDIGLYLRNENQLRAYRKHSQQFLDSYLQRKQKLVKQKQSSTTTSVMDVTMEQFFCNFCVACLHSHHISAVKTLLFEQCSKEEREKILWTLHFICLQRPTHHFDYSILLEQTLMEKREFIIANEEKHLYPPFQVKYFQIEKVKLLNYLVEEAEFKQNEKPSIIIRHLNVPDHVFANPDLEYETDVVQQKEEDTNPFLEEIDTTRETVVTQDTVQKWIHITHNLPPLIGIGGNMLQWYQFNREIPLAGCYNVDPKNPKQLIYLYLKGFVEDLLEENPKPDKEQTKIILEHPTFERVVSEFELIQKEGNIFEGIHKRTIQIFDHKTNELIGHTAHIYSMLCEITEVYPKSNSNNNNNEKEE